MKKFVTLQLLRDDISQIIDGLTERMMIWKATEEYMETGYSHLGDFIEECSGPEEAHSVAQHYEDIVNSIKGQLGD